VVAGSALATDVGVAVAVGVGLAAGCATQAPNDAASNSTHADASDLISIDSNATIRLEFHVPKPTSSGRLPVRDAIAAGGVVLRERDGALEAAIAGRDSDGTWVFPKGTPSEGESTEETALREVAEETGLEVRILGPLGTTEYWFASRGVRFHKRVHFFLMEATGGDVSRHDREYDVVRWVPVEEARALLSFDNYREMLDRAIADWGRVQ